METERVTSDALSSRLIAEQRIQGLSKGTVSVPEEVRVKAAVGRQKKEFSGYRFYKRQNFAHAAKKLYQ